MRRAILRDGTRDTGRGLKALRRDAFLALPYFDRLHRFLPTLVRHDGFDVVDLGESHPAVAYVTRDNATEGV